MKSIEELTRMKNETYIKKEEIRNHREYDKEEELLKLHILYGLYSDNLKYATYKQIMPVIVDVWNSYAGKRLGPKTKEQIENKIKERTGLTGFYISHPHYSPEFVEFYDNGCDLKIQCGDGHMKNCVDHVIQPMNAEDYIVYDVREYRDNEEEFAEFIMKSWVTLNNLYQNFKNQIDDFNYILPSTMETKTAYNFKNYFMIW